jgi:transcriptional regulator with XRE-family HTH domain
MKKTRTGIPNQRLKAERELRGWSQKYVAEQIGADHYYLSRWERGTTSPSPYYRQKLCVLFGKNARELGLLQQASIQGDLSFFHYLIYLETRSVENGTFLRIC